MFDLFLERGSSTLDMRFMGVAASVCEWVKRWVKINVKLVMKLWREIPPVSKLTPINI